MKPSIANDSVLTVSELGMVSPEPEFGLVSPDPDRTNVPQPCRVTRGSEQQGERSAGYPGTWEALPPPSLTAGRSHERFHIQILLSRASWRNVSSFFFQKKN